MQSVKFVIRVVGGALAVNLVLGMMTLISSSALARPADFRGSYRILQSRVLALSYGRGLVLQDGNLVDETAANPARPSCRADRASFDEAAGEVDVTFDSTADGLERARLKTVPQIASLRPTTIECLSSVAFTGALDLSIALGRVVELSR